MKTAAIYVAVSISDQEQDQRVSELRTYALSKNWGVLEYRERHAGARKRPIYGKMLRDAWYRKFEVILVQSLDCFARSLVELSAELTAVNKLGIRLVAVNENIDIDPKTTDGRIFLSTLTVLVKAGKNMIRRNVRSGITRAQSEGVHCGRPQRIFPCPQALKLRKKGMSIRAIAETIGYPVSTVGAALKARSGSCVKSERNKKGLGGTASAAGKRRKGARGLRPRRVFPIFEAGALRETGLSIRAVAAEIDFPVSTVASNLKLYSQEKVRWAAEKVERDARRLKRAELKKANAAKNGGSPNDRGRPDSSAPGN